MKRLILEDTSLTYFPIILPLLGDSEDQAARIILQIAETARPREVVLALKEALSSIEEVMEELEVIDDECITVGKDGVSDEDNGGIYKPLVEQLKLVMRCYITGRHSMKG